MVGFFEWADRIQTYDVGGWNYIEKLKEFTDGGYKDFAFVDAVSGIVNLGCHDPPCRGFGVGTTVAQPHNQKERNNTFQRLLNQLGVARAYPPPPKPTPMPTYSPTEAPQRPPPTTATPTIFEPPTQTPTVSMVPTAIQGRPPEEAVESMDEEIEKKVVVEEKVFSTGNRFAHLLLLSEHPSGEMWPSYLYTYRDFQTALKKMTSGIGPGEKNFFYIGDGYSQNSTKYGLANIAAFLAQGITQSIYYDACDENSWEMVEFRYPISNSCGQEGQSYQDDVCTDEDEGMECEVDLKMEIHGGMHARWVGAPPPMYCGDRSVGYWDHESGIEFQDPPFRNSVSKAVMCVFY